MCRHCRGLVEDKEIVHAFMTKLAERLSYVLSREIPADDLNLEITIKVEAYPNIPAELHFKVEA